MKKNTNTNTLFGITGNGSIAIGYWILETSVRTNASGAFWFLGKHKHKVFFLADRKPRQMQIKIIDAFEN